MRETLDARHLGVLVPDSFDAEVLSVHSRVVNLLLPSGVLVSLVRNPGDMTALAIQVPELDPGRIGSVTFSRRGAYLRGIPAGVAVSLEGARGFAGRPLRGRFFEGAAQELRSAVLRRGSEEGFASLLSRPRNAFARRAASIVAEGPGAFSRLVGLGIGFTPSGDDFLTGYLMASELWSRFHRRSDGADEKTPALGASIEERLGSTTPGGRTLLSLALRGSYPCYLLRFWRSLRGLDGTRGSTAAVEQAVRRVAEHGETSGLDAVTGFVCFLLTTEARVI